MKPRLTIAALLFCGCLGLAAQTAPAPSPSVQQIQKLADGQHWDEITRMLGPVPSRTADMDFYYGMALARLKRWTEAEKALEAGRRLAPRDPRFPVELAGIAFEQKKYPQAAHHLRRAVKLSPKDAYTNDFLGTVYYLEDNLPASLKYWNRVGKPAIVAVRNDPEPRVSPVLLDRAFAFSPASTLLLPQYLDTEVRLRGLGIFPQYHFDLQARSDGKFDLLFRNNELDSYGDSKWQGLFLFLRGLPFQEVNPGLYNLRGHAINFTSMYRWDAQKRRIFADLSGPFEGSAKYRWEYVTDLRDENWAIRNGFAGPAPVLASFNMRHEMLAFDLASYASARWNWSAGAEASHRNFRSVAPGVVLTPQILATGYQLKQEAQIGDTLWRVPERRFTVDAAASTQAGRLWSRQPESFEKLAGSMKWHWFPRAEGGDYETTQQFRAGKIFGQAPLDELYILGLERDNDLPMRAHIGTRDGRKGSAPLGRDYFLENWQTDKNIYGNGLMNVQLGPLLDIGKITDPGTQLGSHQWLFDTGAEVRLRIFSSGIIFSYGKDLRTGNNAFYFRLLGQGER